MEKRRVVVTGIGALTPIGNTAPEFWEGLVAGKSGAAPITHSMLLSSKLSLLVKSKTLISRILWTKKKPVNSISLHNMPL